MSKNINHLQHIKSNVVDNGKPKLPQSSVLVEGELAVNYATGFETISLKNSNNEIVRFSSDDYYTEQKLGSGFTGANSAITVTKVIVDNEKVVSSALNTLNTNKADLSGLTSHTSDTSIHLNSTEKTNIDALETNIESISGINSTKVSNWDSAFSDKHTHSNKTYLDGITGNVGTAAYKGVSTGITNSTNLIEAKHIYSGVVTTAAYDSTAKTITFSSTSGNVLSTIDATDFIKDGMVDNVSIEVLSGDTYLVISFNTDSGKEDINILLSDIFDASNYYNKTDIDNKLNPLSGKTVTEIGSSNTSISATSTAATDGTVKYDLVTDASKIKMSGFTADTSGLTSVTTSSTVTEAIKAIETEIIDNEETISAALNYLNETRIEIDGQSGDTYVADSGSTHISGATSLHDADIKLNNAIETVETSIETIEASITPNAENITYSALKTKRDGGTLVPGQFYRITDYVTTTSQAETQSAGHQFDVIVRADSTNTLNENAYAALHSSDTYFANSKLEAWQLKYCLDNDTDKFQWADTTNGKGVIYYMKDEFDNECPYDFKNIQFKWSYTKSVSGIKANVFYYTFSWVSGTNDAIVRDLSLDESFLCYNNIIKISESFEIPELSFNVFRNTTYYGCINNTLETHCRQNTFGDGCYYNTFGDECHYNTFGNNFQSNTFGSNCSSNTFGNDCQSNTFGNNCQSNTFGNNCQSNTFGNNCQSNTFGNNCQSNTFGNYCTDIKFGNSSSVKNYYKNIIVENGNQYIYLDCSATTSSSNYCQNIKIAQGVNNSTTYKTITHSTVNDAFQTEYKASASQITLV